MAEDEAVWRRAAGEAFVVGGIEQIRSWIFKITRETGFLLVRPGAHFLYGQADH